MFVPDFGHKSRFLLLSSHLIYCASATATDLPVVVEKAQMYGCAMTMSPGVSPFVPSHYRDAIIPKCMQHTFPWRLAALLYFHPAVIICARAIPGSTAASKTRTSNICIVPSSPTYHVARHFFSYASSSSSSSPASPAQSLVCTRSNGVSGAGQ